MADAIGDARKRDLDVTTEVADDLPPARMDGMRIAQAVCQLVRNAIRFTPDGGMIDVRAFREKEQLVIEVRDTGIGIPEEKARDLFDKSFMVRDSLHHHSSSKLEFNLGGARPGPRDRARDRRGARRHALPSRANISRGTTVTMRVPYECNPGLKMAALAAPARPRAASRLLRLGLTSPWHLLTAPSPPLGSPQSWGPCERGDAKGVTFHPASVERLEPARDGRVV